MDFSAVYICPVRGLAGLEPPDPDALREASRTAGALGLRRFELPVLEEALLGPAKARVKYLDGLILALDRIADGGLSAALIAPAQRLCGVDFIPPHLAGATPSGDSRAVFTAGKFRNLDPFPWWKDVSIIEKRLKTFREIVSALAGHPAVSDWVILDRLMSWTRPGPETVDMFSRAQTAEIRDRDESTRICMSLDTDFYAFPESYGPIPNQAAGLRLAGLDRPPRGLPEPANPAEGIAQAAYLGALTRWLTNTPVQVETGWSGADRPADPDLFVHRIAEAAGSGLEALGWFNFADPGPGQAAMPPWTIRPGLDRAALCDSRFQPKDWAEDAVKAAHAGRPKPGALDFIDIDREEYEENPEMHLPRLWGHFKDKLS